MMRQLWRPIPRDMGNRVNKRSVLCDEERSEGGMAPRIKEDVMSLMTTKLVPSQLLALAIIVLDLLLFKR